MEIKNVTKTFWPFLVPTAVNGTKSSTSLKLQLENFENSFGNLELNVVDLGRSYCCFLSYCIIFDIVTASLLMNVFRSCFQMFYKWLFWLKSNYSTSKPTIHSWEACPNFDKTLLLRQTVKKRPPALKDLLRCFGLSSLLLGTRYF